MVTICGKHNLRKPWLEKVVQKFLAFLELQKFLGNICFLERLSLGGHQSAWVLHCVSLSRKLSLLTCVDQLERHSRVSVVVGQTQQIAGAGVPELDKIMYIIVYLVKMVSFLSVMFANSSAIAPRSLEWLYDSGKLATLTLTTHLGQNVGSFLTWMIPSLWRSDPETGHQTGNLSVEFFFFFFPHLLSLYECL